MISIIIVNYNVYNDVLTCIESIKEFTKNISYEIIVVDNNSFERDIDGINSIYPEVSYIRLKDNRGFGAANNIAMSKASGEYILLVNPDIVFIDNSIKRMSDYLEKNSGVGVVGPVFIKPEGDVESYYRFFPSLYSRFLQQIGLYMRSSYMRKRREVFYQLSIEKNRPFQIDWILGACMMLRRKTFEETGGFDETFFLYEEEVDWQKRILSELGLKSFILPEVKVLHNHHSSTYKEGLAFMRYHGFRSMIIFTSKHDKSIIKLLNKLMHTISITYRLLRGFFLKRYRLINFKTHTLLFINLYKLNWVNKKNLFNYKFIFKVYNQ